MTLLPILHPRCWPVASTQRGVFTADAGDVVLGDTR